ncbi:hypothetical protein [Brachyspira sp.]|uniref:hypothetical protein n=1 Tax=Brachyspira sp. TaxID=1977261 RepID=UPI0026346951|nr:hypothetical protein [Brachyspira sp.]
MGKIKNVFTMATLYLIKNLLNFSSRLLPVFIIIISLLKLSKVLIDLSWYLVLSILLIEIILVVISLIFDSVFFKNKKTSYNNKENQSNAVSENVEKKFPVLNITVVFFAFLGIIFVILKLFKAIAWSWVWVLSPLWLSTALVLFILLICIIVFIISVFSKKGDSANIEENISESSTSSESENNINTNKTE